MGELATLRVDIAEARELVLKAARIGTTWPCPHCGAARTHEDGWWSVHTLREAAGISGPAAMIAVNQLVASGELLMDSRLRVRLPLPGSGEFPRKDAER